MSERTTRVISERDRVAEHWLTLPTSPIVSVNARNGNHFRLRLTSNATLEPPFEPHSGQRILLRIEQDGTGGWTLTPNSAGITVKGSVTEDTTAGAVAFWEMVYDEVAKMWEVWSLTASSSAGANTGLTNLASVAIDVSLDPATDLTYTIGSGSKHWQTTFTREVKGGATLYLYAQTTDDTLLYLGATGSGFLQAGGDFTLWYGSALYFDADRHVGDAGTTGFDKTAKTGSGGNFNCKYEGTVAWRLESATTMYLNDCNLKLGVSTGTKIGTTTAQKLGFWGATPVVQQAAISDASGGAVVDDQARAAINSALAVLRTLGIIAP